MTQCAVQSLWVGGPLSALERLCLASFVRHGHPFHLYAYDEVPNAPRGVVLKDAAAVLPREQVFKERELGSYAAFANLFRYKLLLENGGVWCDADVTCVKPWCFKTDMVFSEQRTPEGGREVNNNVMKVPAGAEVMAYCLAQARVKVEAGYTWGELGPALLTSAIERFGLRDAVLPPNAFNPIDYWQADSLISASIGTRLRLEARLVSGVYGIHLWHSIWTRRGMDPSAHHPRYCLYESLRRRYCTDQSQ